MPRCNLTQSGTWRGAGDAIEGQLAMLGYMDAIEENLIDDQMQVVLGYVEWCWGRPKAAGLEERSGEELHRSSKRRRMRRGEATLPAAPLPDRWVDVDTVNDTVTVANTVANTVAIDLCSDAEIDMYADMPPLTISSDEEPGPDIEMTGFIPPQVENDVCALRASRYGLKAHVFQRMVFLGVPCFILNCTWPLYNDVNCTDARDLDYVEFMSGEGNIFGSMLEMMLHACGYDNKLHPILQNLLCPTGCLCAIQLLRRLAPGGGTSWALVCASWVWMSRSKTRRSLARPLGPDDPAERIAAVVDGNQMVSIFAALLLWIVSMGDVQWLWSNPPALCWCTILGSRPSRCSYSESGRGTASTHGWVRLGADPQEHKALEFFRALFARYASHTSSQCHQYDVPGERDCDLYSQSGEEGIGALIHHRHRGLTRQSGLSCRIWPSGSQVIPGKPAGGRHFGLPTGCHASSLCGCVGGRWLRPFRSGSGHSCRQTRRLICASVLDALGKLRVGAQTKTSL